MGRALLFLVFGLMIVYGIVHQTMLNRQSSVLPARSNNYMYEQQVRNLANGIIDATLIQLKSNSSWDAGDVRISMPEDFGAAGWVKIFDQDSPPDSLPPDHSAGDPATWDENVLLFWSEASLNGYTAQTEVKMDREAFSKFSYFTNYEPSSLYFYTDDHLSGPVHTNSTLYIAGEPVFDGKVSSPNPWQGHPSYTNTPHFNSGTDFNADSISLPGTSQMDALRTAAANAGLQYQNPIRVIMEESGGTGGVNIYRSDDCCWGSETLYTLSESQYQGKVVSSDGDVLVKGRLKGALTIHSGTNIEIIGDVEYAQDPLVYSNATDLLGLVSEGDVVLDENAHTENGSSDVTLHGSILALNNSFRVENYGDGSVRGTINLLGGIIQNQRGPVGTFDSNGNLTSGFAKNYTYDERLRELVPPHFPRKLVFTFGYWKEQIVERPDN